jgi:hypothetical protein
MHTQGNPLRNISLSGRAAHAMYRWMALSVVVACAAAPVAFAQNGWNVPTIRVEAHEVFIPTFVGANGPRGVYLALQLAARDFHVFEDGKEQEISSVALVGLDRTLLQVGNLDNPERTSSGVWKTFPEPPDFGLGSTVLPYYGISYRPPISPERSCHVIKIKVDPKDESGRRLTTADSVRNLVGNSAQNPVGTEFDKITEKMDRRNLFLVYRRQYCNVAHFENDPLYGTPVSKKLEIFATKGTKNRADEEGFYLGVIDHFDESNASRVHVTLDFRNYSNQTGIHSFEVALLGMFSRANGDLAARFSDNSSQGCFIDQSEADQGLQQMCDQSHFSNHYETEVDLTPGDYDLRVAIDFGGALRRAEIPVNVRAPENRLAVSGLALCKHYSPHDQA